MFRWLPALRSIILVKKLVFYNHMTSQGFVTLVIVIMVIIGVYLAFFNDSTVTEGAGEGFGMILGFIGKIFYFIYFILLGIIVLPAMLIMASLYRTWEAWIKDFVNMHENIIKAILLLPLTILIGYAMMIMAVFHKFFEECVIKTFGRKLF